MITNELARKLSKEFDQKYGTKWESQEHLAEAFDYFMREKWVSKSLDVIKMMFFETVDKDKFAWKLNAGLSKFIIDFDRVLEDPYLSNDSKKSACFNRRMLTHWKNFVIDLHTSYRLSYPNGTEAVPEPIPEEFFNHDFDNDADKEEDWLTVEDVAALIGVTVKTVYRKANSRELPSYKIGKSYKFKRNEIMELVNQSRRKSMDEISVDAEMRIKRF